MQFRGPFRGNIKFSNGEAVPTFDKYVRTAKEEGIRRVVEIKTQRPSANGTHTQFQNNNRVVNAAISIVRKYGYEPEIAKDLTTKVFLEE